MKELENLKVNSKISEEIFDLEKKILEIKKNLMKIQDEKIEFMKQSIKHESDDKLIKKQIDFLNRRIEEEVNESDSMKDPSSLIELLNKSVSEVNFKKKKELVDIP